jgi:hypothetical protein
MFNARMVRGRFIDRIVTIKKAARGAIARTTRHSLLARLQ